MGKATGKTGIPKGGVTMEDIIIRIRDVKKIYQMGNEAIHAVDGVSLNIHQGEVCCLLGKSGSGKSTLLNLMAGLEKPTAGTFCPRNLPTMSS